jgi:UDP-N-acetylglucosamine--N-acetylmuramyl-(pentapeptide) pyrophosphoryl-undecaprenol N-acetylglucosamine transferase
VIGYYIHHQGRGHLHRATTICAQLHQPVTALTSLPLSDCQAFDEVVKLPRDDDADDVTDVSGNGAWHWVPLYDNGLRERMAILADWVATARPTVVVTDVSVEVAALVRLFGVAVVVIAMPGQRDDPPHELAYRMADRIVAPWPAEMYEPTCLAPYQDKTSYVGGISRFDGRQTAPISTAAPTRVLAMFGAGGSAVDAASIAGARNSVPEVQWVSLGAPGGLWVDDPWDELCAADVVVAHAGQNSVADIAAARRPAIVIPQDRPFAEQDATAAVLTRERLAVVEPHWPEPSRWPALIARARHCDGGRWERWQTSGSAARAAAVIEEVASRRGIRR